MNERIRQLSKQAGDYVNETYTGPVRSKTPGKIWEDGHVGWHTQFNEKFAELIVRECAKICIEQNVSNLDLDVIRESGKFTLQDLATKSCGENLSKQIKQHFGVEE